MEDSVLADLISVVGVESFYQDRWRAIYHSVVQAQLYLPVAIWVSIP